MLYMYTETKYLHNYNLYKSTFFIIHAAVIMDVGV